MVSDYLQHVRARAGEARAREEAARRQVAEAKRARAFWDRLLAQITEGSPAATLLLLRREESYLRRLREAGDPAAPVLEAVRADAERRAREHALNFERAFPEALRAAGIEVDRTSRHPRYTVKDGFLRVVVDDDALTATLATRDGAEATLGMDVEPLAETVRAQVARLFGREPDHAAVARRIYAAYVAVLQSEGRPAGAPVSLRPIVGYLSRNERDFAADELNVDLARLIQSGETLVDGCRMRVDHTRDAAQGMLLHGLEQGGYVGFVSFAREGAPC